MSEMTYVNLLRRQRFICLLRITSLATANTIDLLQDPGNKTSSFPQTQPKMIPWGRRAVWKLHWSEERERPVILWYTALDSSCHHRRPWWTSGSSSLCFYPITSSKEEIKLVIAWNESSVPLSGLIYLSLLQNAPSVRMPSSTNMGSPSFCRWLFGLGPRLFSEVDVVFIFTLFMCALSFQTVSFASVTIFTQKVSLLAKGWEHSQSLVLSQDCMGKNWALIGNRAVSLDAWDK